MQALTKLREKKSLLSSLVYAFFSSWYANIFWKLWEAVTQLTLRTTLKKNHSFHPYHLLPSKLLSNTHCAWTSERFALSNRMPGSPASQLCNNKPLISWRYTNEPSLGVSAQRDFPRTLSRNSHPFSTLNPPPLPNFPHFRLFAHCNFEEGKKPKCYTMSSLNREGRRLREKLPAKCMQKPRAWLSPHWAYRFPLSACDGNSSTIVLGWRQAERLTGEAAC